VSATGHSRSRSSRTASRKTLNTPFNQLFCDRTPLAALGDYAASNPGIAPDGFIFHVSRCGSTLVSQMLAALPDSIVLSEAGPDRYGAARASRRSGGLYGSARALASVDGQRAGPGAARRTPPVRQVRLLEHARTTADPPRVSGRAVDFPLPRSGRGCWFRR